VENGGGGELKLGHDREENDETRERVVSGSFSSASVAWGSEAKKEGGPAGAATWQRAGCGRRGAGAADRWGWDESKAQCQRRGAGGRGVSEAARWWGTNRGARPAHC
jgi:hypothetical protein